MLTQGNWCFVSACFLIMVFSTDLTMQTEDPKGHAGVKNL